MTGVFLSLNCFKFSQPSTRYRRVAPISRSNIPPAKLMETISIFCQGVKRFKVVGYPIGLSCSGDSCPCPESIQPGLCINSLLQPRRLHLSAVKKSSGLLHRLCDPQAGAPGLDRDQPVADQNRMSGTSSPVWLRLCHPNCSGEPLVASHRLAPTSLRDKNLCIIRAKQMMRGLSP